MNAEYSIAVRQLPDTKELAFKPLQSYSDGRAGRWIELDENGEWPPSHLGGQGPAQVSRAEPSRSPGGRRG